MKSDPRQARGQSAEEIAADFLVAQGFKIVCRNFRSRFGEIDLIAAKDKLLVFAEVKGRYGQAYGRGAESVTFAKQRKIVRTAQWYLARKPAEAYVRFDVLEIDLGAPAAAPIWYQAAFEVPS